jgi:hypothetical protein
VSRINIYRSIYIYLYTRGSAWLCWSRAVELHTLLSANLNSRSVDLFLLQNCALSDLLEYEVDFKS